MSKESDSVDDSPDTNKEHSIGDNKPGVPTPPQGQASMNSVPNSRNYMNY